MRRNVPSGVNSWRQLCPVKDAPLDDDDDDESVLAGYFKKLWMDFHQILQLEIGIILVYRVVK